MRIALVSLNQFWEDKLGNKKSVEKIIKKAVADSADLIIFPEMTLTGFSMDVKKISEIAENSNTIEFFRNSAKDDGISIIFGYVENKLGNAFNNCVLVNSTGNVIASYSKIHPFSFAGETKYYSHGNSLVQLDFMETNMALTICYDLRFPELYQALSKESEIIINIANWPKKRVDHWNTLLKARAIENQVFMIGVNRTGIDGNNIEYEKSSLIFAPDGTMLDPDNLEYELDFYDINHEMVSEVRNIFPVKNDRKIELYKRIL